MPSERYDETYRASRDVLRDTVLDVAATLFALLVALVALYVAIYGSLSSRPGGLLLSALGGLAFVACVGGVCRLWRVWPFS
ncbi:hypothetical protein MBEHAL_0990 [Halarchaeum acidiphilum MH1-52-1]|uniref:Uncharacterized protein n=1 Tax=Halarchaeum acidiphilum MH1-52-1 TaxID=1261545 RepID=U2YT92_9EURY|nr:hypothetical protein [Halarchaeum acidiphilum]GAD52230.1 hypothetical protein MBEHAL_0990 [Halarchaeum acidiphilum MH1-52-1]